ncbi:MAG: DMT family transporter [Bacillota bacterium]|nr:DMT family transporter [Bacillota bacterium]
MKKQTMTGHVLAFITIFIWGTTFAATKILLKAFTPEEILFYRFLIACLILVFVYPKRHGFLGIKEELLFFALGLTGVTLYFFMENLALQYTLATNVGLISSSVPIFTALIAHFSTRDEKFSVDLIFGFIAAMAGIFIIIYNGRVLKLNPSGDILAVMSAVVFAIYSVLLKKVDSKYKQAFVVKKTFFYGFICIIPITLVSGLKLQKLAYINYNIVFNILFLAVCASVMCFIMWNKAVSVIGAVRTSNYIYFVPLITMAASVIVLKEQVNATMIIGGILIFVGVYFNEAKLVSRLKLKSLRWERD